ncbi:hypothetical protein V6N12_050666 [Hibiscus sabdariffa]|uniref:Uncharacterized protein n=1 Tax=Hibiscus sabdariffa TaxID=183260 RepID=A0ABR2GD20_9ROSI
MRRMNIMEATPVNVAMPLAAVGPSTSHPVDQFAPVEQHFSPSAAPRGQPSLASTPDFVPAAPKPQPEPAQTTIKPPAQQSDIASIGGPHRGPPNSVHGIYQGIS